MPSDRLQPITLRKQNMIDKMLKRKRQSQALFMAYAGISKFPKTGNWCSIS